MALYHTRSLNILPPAQTYTHSLRPRAISWPTRMPQHQQPQPLHSDINTVHVAYRPGVTDRGHLYLHFRTYAGFELFAFYDHYCFVRFVNQDFARQALLRPSPDGIITLEPAQKNYRVPYPQPEEDSAPCKAIHVTHLPTNYSKDEMCKVFRAFPGFIKVQFHGKYGYVFFEEGQSAATCWRTLRLETNLVVSYAKNAKLEDEDLQNPMSYNNVKNNGNKTNSNNAHASNTNHAHAANGKNAASISMSGNPAHDFYRLRSKLHNIPVNHLVNGLDEGYTFLPRDSVRQLDADLKNDFEQLLIESHCRLCPAPFGPPSGASSPTSGYPNSFGGDDEDTHWISDSSCEQDQTAFLSDADSSSVSGLISPAIRTRSGSTAGSSTSPDASLNRSTPMISNAPWDIRRRASFSNLQVESRASDVPSSNGNGIARYPHRLAADAPSQKAQQQPQVKQSLLPKPAYYPNPMVPEFRPSCTYQAPPLTIPRRGSYPNPQHQQLRQQYQHHQQPPIATAAQPSQSQHSLLSTWQLSPPFPLAPTMVNYRAPAHGRESHLQIA
ncbi:hypothetical protein DFJ77DRAFT_507587 [Powellomyces hirtus]|nr:hypothetical protein DFJ77DRAFT_507587 [Powellomyces hirtus]